MESFAGKLAVVTGGGTGMGRELVIRLAAEGCSVATCDINEDALATTAEHAAKAAPGGVRVTTHLCDVADEAQVAAFRDEVTAAHATAHVNLLFNNAGVGGGGSFVTGSRKEWDRTFAICWGGVYNCTRAFVPLLIAADEAVLVNTSSVNGFWASLGPGLPHTAYSTAKFAVKGFSEALLEDFRVNAPHVRVALVMPGHIGTDIVINTREIHGEPSPEEVAHLRTTMIAAGALSPGAPDDAVHATMRTIAENFRDQAPTTPAEAVTIILNGIHTRTWRILVGEDAHTLDTTVRADPLSLYTADSASLLSLAGSQVSLAEDPPPRGSTDPDSGAERAD
ncbi:SDR family NAD(P)-dependent oxidoreductase [Sphaerisporangium aureirubrum]|uniref:SDR family NAD(P)-dependent oxidoreductase n=1 Tax=Sphaerisporangium aureirubrum TaxID=1544736 RepID=A0ABW1NQ69_9ACTN